MAELKLRQIKQEIVFADVVVGATIPRFRSDQNDSMLFVEKFVLHMRVVVGAARQSSKKEG